MTGVLCMLIAASLGAESPTPQQYLEELRRVLPESKPFEAWLEQRGELPPDFAKLPVQDALPDPLRWVDPETHAVTEIGDTAGWEAQRAVLKQQLQHWVTGMIPPRPDNLAFDLLEEELLDSGVSRRLIDLRFGPEQQAHLRLELFVPAGDTPRPVFMTQHNHRQWGLVALSRGYVVVVYSGADSQDDTESFIAAYPEYDWSKLMRRAWAASRCVDYLELAVPQANLQQIAITGHSRNGKTALMAAAMDERFAVVISSSSGVGGACASRALNESTFGEGIEMITRNFPDWFHPRWRFFSGREEYCPVDLHQLVALAAPRACLITTALNDGVESTSAVEATYHAVQPVWALYGQEEKLRIEYRPFGHETKPGDIARYVDWCDVQFGRGDYAFPETLVEPQAKAPQVAMEPGMRPIGERAYDPTSMTIPLSVSFGPFYLGIAPPHLPGAVGDYGLEPDHIETLLRRTEAGAGLEKEELVFGEYINADVYLPRRSKGDTKLPGILWLHPASRPAGYVAAYARGEQAFRTFARAGYAVFCYDQIGNGRRIEEATDFYTRYPQWTLFGKMLRDAQDALAAFKTMGAVDPENITVVGYGLGAWVGAALVAQSATPVKALLIAPPAEIGPSAPYPWARVLTTSSVMLKDVLPSAAATSPTVVLPSIPDRGVPAGIPNVVMSGTYDHFGPEVQELVLETLKRR